MKNDLKSFLKCYELFLELLSSKKKIIIYKLPFFYILDEVSYIPATCLIYYV